VAPLALNWPDAQLLHEVEEDAPIVAEYLPAVQLVQVEEEDAPVEAK